MAKIIDLTFLWCLKEYKRILDTNRDKANQSRLWRKRYPKEVREQVLEFLYSDQKRHRLKLKNRSIL